MFGRAYQVEVKGDTVFYMPEVSDVKSLTPRVFDKFYDRVYKDASKRWSARNKLQARVDRRAKDESQTASECYNDFSKYSKTLADRKKPELEKPLPK